MGKEGGPENRKLNDQAGCTEKKVQEILGTKSGWPKVSGAVVVSAKSEGKEEKTPGRKKGKKGGRGIEQEVQSSRGGRQTTDKK